MTPKGPAPSAIDNVEAPSAETAEAQRNGFIAHVGQDARFFNAVERLARQTKPQAGGLPADAIATHARPLVGEQEGEAPLEAAAESTATKSAGGASDASENPTSEDTTQAPASGAEPLAQRRTQRDGAGDIIALSKRHSLSKVVIDEPTPSATVGPVNDPRRRGLFAMLALGLLAVGALVYVAAGDDAGQDASKQPTSSSEASYGGPALATVGMTARVSAIATATAEPPVATSALSTSEPAQSGTAIRSGAPSVAIKASATAQAAPSVTSVATSDPPRPSTSTSAKPLRTGWIPQDN